MFSISVSFSPNVFITSYNKNYIYIFKYILLLSHTKKFLIFNLVSHESNYKSFIVPVNYYDSSKNSLISLSGI